MARQPQCAIGVDGLVDLDRPALLELWQEHFDHPPPAYCKSEFLVRAIAWESQGQVQGGLAPALVRLLHRIAKGEASSSSGNTATRKIKPGTRLIRTWHGQTHDVEVLDNGYAWRGARYRSLSAIAREITGSRWNGPRFFGLKGKVSRSGGNG
jgi:hypothetical protein